MKEEELIKKLEDLKFPQIKLQNHQYRLKMALLDAGYPREQQKITILELAKFRIKGGINIMLKGLLSQQPIWKSAVAGVVAMALVIGLIIGLPSLTGQPPEVLAADIAQNSPQVQAALDGEDVQVVKIVRLEDSKGTVLCKGEMGFAIVNVDLKAKQATEVIPISKLTEADRQEAINIAKSDPSVKELLDKGASIGKVSPMCSFGIAVNSETGKLEEFSGTLARIALELGERSWVAEVDLDEGKVVRLIESISPSLTSEFSSKGKVEYFVKDSQ